MRAVAICAGLVLISVPGLAQQGPGPQVSPAPEPMSEAEVPAEPEPPNAEVSDDGSESQARTMAADAVTQQQEAQAKLGAMQLAVAEEAALQSESDAKDEKATADLARSGKLMSSGVTLGTALSVQTPLGKYGQKTAAAVAMPYIMVLPGYFGARQTVRQYCAAAWGAGDDAEATEAALGAARKSAKHILEGIKSDLEVGRTRSAIVTTWFPASADSINQNSFGAVIVKKVAEAVVPNENSKDPIKKLEATRAREAVLDALANDAWSPTQHGKCFWRGFGAWLGRPLDYSSTTRFSGGSRVEREMKPVVAFGLGYTPHAYLSFLVGVTISSVSVADSAGVSEDRSVWSGTVAIGGNVDLLGELLK